MTKTATRPLPTSLQLLREHWSPSEPSDTNVSRARSAQAVIWAAVTAASAHVDRLEAAEQAAVVAVVDAALAGDAIDQALAELSPNPELLEAQRHLDLLRLAGTLATQRLTMAQLSDETFLDWQRQCRDLEHEWERANNDSDDRTGALLMFAEEHQPS